MASTESGTTFGDEEDKLVETCSAVKIAPAIVLPWFKVKDKIQWMINHCDPYDYSICLTHCLEVRRTLRHPGSIRCFSHFTAPSGAQLFLVHFRGHCDQFAFWKVHPESHTESFYTKKYDISHVYTCMIYIKLYRLYVCAGADLVMNLLSDAKVNFQARISIKIPCKLICMVFNTDRDELVAGAVGRIIRWSFKGLKTGEEPAFLGRYKTDISVSEWVTDIRIDYHHTELIALCGVNICIINYYLETQMQYVNSHHATAMMCSAVYFVGGYIMTAGRDCIIKVWNRANFMVVHEFVAHTDIVTDMRIHPRDPFLYSCSLDRYINVWRLDTFQKYMSLPVYEPVYHLTILEKGNLFVQLESSIQCCYLNQFFKLFDILSSSPLSLARVGFPGSPARIFIATEDGSLRCSSPLTGETINLVYPLPSFLVMKNFAYDSYKNEIFTLVGKGDVLVLDSTANPCQGKQRWRTKNSEENISCICHVLCEINNKSHYWEPLFFAGHENGYISLISGLTFCMTERVSAHRTKVTHLYDCTPDWSGNVDQLTPAGRLLSAADGSIRMWEIVFDSDTNSIVLQQTHVLRVPQVLPISFLCVMDHMLAVIYENKRSIILYRCKSVQRIGIQTKPARGTILLLHRTDIHNEHTDQITYMDKCPSANIFVTSSSDGFVKFWDCKNHMIRELSFGRPVLSCCFANPRGDVLVGYDKYIMFVSVEKYMPDYLLESLLKKEFLDDVREEVIPMSSLEEYTDMHHGDVCIYEVTFNHAGKVMWSLAKGSLPIRFLEYEHLAKHDIEAIAEKVLKYYRQREKPKKASYVPRRMSFRRAGQLVLTMRQVTIKVVGKKSSRLEAFTEGDEVKEHTTGDRIPLCHFLHLPQKELNAEFSLEYQEHKEQAEVMKAKEKRAEEIRKTFLLAQAQTDSTAITEVQKATEEDDEIEEMQGLGTRPIIAPDGHIPNSVIRKLFTYKKVKSKKKKKVLFFCILTI